MTATEPQLHVELELGSEYVKELAYELFDYDVRSHLSPDSLINLRGPGSPKLELSIDQRAIASLVHVLLRWWAHRQEEVVFTAAEQTFVIKDESSADELLEFVRQQIEQKYTPDSHGSGGDWES